jgi:hypothetical protein
MRLGTLAPTFAVLCIFSPGFSARPAAVTISVPLERRANARLASDEYLPSAVVSGGQTL